MSNLTKSEEPYEYGLDVTVTSSFDERSRVTGSSGLSTDPSPSWILRAHCNPVSRWYLEAVS